MASLQGLWKVFYEPDRVFEESRGFLWPFVLGLLLTLLALWIVMPLLSQLQLEKLQQMMPQNSGSDFNPKAFQQRLLLYSMLSALVVYPLKILLQGLVFNGVMPLVGGEGVYGHALVAAVYGSWVSAVGNLVKAVISRLTSIFPLHLDLAVLLPDTLVNTPLGHLFSQVDLFTLWSLWVIGTGLAVLYGTERRKGYLVAFGVWLVYLLLVGLIVTFAPGPNFARLGG